MSELKKTQTTESVVENLTVVIKSNLKEFKEKQVLLVKENPFIEITDLKTYEAAKKSRTSLVSGRTALQKQLTLINAKLNPVKTFVKTEIDALIEVSKPAEDKQQTEVKRFETIKETERIEREAEKQKLKDAVKDYIDEIITDWTNTIEGMTFEQIDSVQSEMEAYFSEIETEKFEDLEIYFSGKLASLNNIFQTKSNELKKDQELLVSQSENRFQQFKTKWMERFMNANINNIHQLNIDFDSEVPEIDADTFFTFKDEFIQATKDFRSKLIDITNTCKLQQEQADKAAEEKEKEVAKETARKNEENRIANAKESIKLLFEELTSTVYVTTYDSIITSAAIISESFDEVRVNKEYAEFKDLIELNISNIENSFQLKQKDLIEKNLEFEESEKVRIAKEKETAEALEKKEKAEAKKKLAADKKRQKELKPLKEASVSQINSITIGYSFDCKNKEVQEIMSEFLSDVKKLQNNYIVRINEL